MTTCQLKFKESKSKWYYPYIMFCDIQFYLVDKNGHKLLLSPREKDNFKPVDGREVEELEQRLSKALAEESYCRNKLKELGVV